MGKPRSSDAILGISVAGRTIHAVLVEKRESGPAIVKQFARQRSHQPSLAAAAVANRVPELQDQSSSDFTLEFGDTPASMGSNDFFLSGDLDGEGAEGAPGASAAESIAGELSELLNECKAVGLPRPSVAFCLDASYVTHVELRVLGKRKDQGKRQDRDSRASRKGQAPEQSVKRSELLDLLKAQHLGDAKPDAVAFIPMSPASDGAQRYLALVPKSDEPISHTVKAFRQNPEAAPKVHGLDTETSILLGLARTVVGDSMFAGDRQADDNPRHTLVVRVGHEDTAVLFLRDSKLAHAENLRSLTSFDSAETICSRLLLQQDEQGIDEIHHVLLLGDKNETRLVESFRMFFPDADVRSLRRYLPQPPDDRDGSSQDVAAIPALGVALRLLDDARKPFFDEVNLLPKKLLRTQLHMPFGWTSLALLALIVVTGIFFFARYTSMDSEMEVYRQKLRAYPPEISLQDPTVLQARIDSMNQAYAGYMRALDVLDSMLVGSNRWSSGMAGLSSETAAVAGIWVESWRPARAGHNVEVRGAAMNRERVVRLAERLDANIKSLTFSEIRDYPVFEYEMDVPLPAQLPRAAVYLRQQVDLNAPVSGSSSSVTPVAPAAYSAQ